MMPNIRSVPLRFISPFDYGDVFEPLCEIEAEYDRQMKEGQNKTNVKVRWEMGVFETLEWDLVVFRSEWKKVGVFSLS
jgi:hypothetical protein